MDFSNSPKLTGGFLGPLEQGVTNRPVLNPTTSQLKVAWDSLWHQIGLKSFAPSTQDGTEPPTKPREPRSNKPRESHSDESMHLGL